MADPVISTHFSYKELTRSSAASRMGIDNTPNEAQVANLKRLALTVLEPAKELLGGVPFRVDSGFRCEAVNKAVGSTAKKSAHLDGRAADIVPKVDDLRAAFDKIRASDIPVDQLILESNSWLHFGIAAEGVKPRRQFLIATGGPGNWSYVPAPAL